MPVNMLSELAKRGVAYSGQADIGDVPPLYALQRAAQQAAAERALSGAGGPAGAGGVQMPPMGGGGAVGGTADTGLPGQLPFGPMVDTALVRQYRDLQREAPGEGRGAPGRTAGYSPEVEAFLEDYFGFLQNPFAMATSVPGFGQLVGVLGSAISGLPAPEAAPLTPESLVAHVIQTTIENMLGGGDAGSAADIGAEAAALEGAAPDIAGTGLAEETASRGYQDVTSDFEDAVAGMIADIESGGGDAGSGSGGGGGSGPGSAGGAPGGAQGQGM